MTTREKYFILAGIIILSLFDLRLLFLAGILSLFWIKPENNKNQ